tara:strand:- start:1481 stop:1777 length:297 start_codon:yes stop_codon:yes gene_type:complete
MKFLQIINQKKFTLISVFLFIYLFANLLDGERGLISYYEKQKMKDNLIKEKESIISKLAYVEKKNSLLTSAIDLDFLEILYREKFMVGKPNEEIYITK